MKLTRQMFNTSYSTVRMPSWQHFHLRSLIGNYQRSDLVSFPLIVSVNCNANFPELLIARLPGILNIMTFSSLKTEVMAFSNHSLKIEVMAF